MINYVICLTISVPCNRMLYNENHYSTIYIDNKSMFFNEIQTLNEENVFVIMYVDNHIIYRYKFICISTHAYI